MANTKNVKADKCQGHAHPEPTLDERSDLHAKLYDALQVIGAAWGYANRTPAFHNLTDPLGEVSVELTRIKRMV